MTRQDIINDIHQAAQGNATYAYYLENVISKMQPYQAEYFYDHVAPYYLYGPGRDDYGSMYKDMEYMARAVSQDKDVSGILGIDFRKIGSMLNSLPTLQSQEQTYGEPVQQLEKTDSERIENINNLINKHILYTQDGRVGSANQTFCQSSNLDLDSIPRQGWKFHISASDLQDYERLLETMCPEFERLGVAYKVVRPEKLQEQINSVQIGKAITIYPTPSFDIHKFSPELRSILREESLHPIGEAQIEGRTHARYGQFRVEVPNGKDLIGQDGKTEKDIRGEQAKPEFVTEMYVDQILGFYSDCAQRYNETGDFKTYLQEAATMTCANGNGRAFVTLEMNAWNEQAIRTALKLDDNGNSFVYKVNDQKYALLHNDVADKILNYLEQNNVDYVRPDWDKRYNVYAICPEDLGTALTIINQFNQSKMISENFPEMSSVMLDENSYGIKVDTTLNRQFIDICINHNIGIRPELINASEMQYDRFRDQILGNLEQTRGGLMQECNNYDDSLIRY